MANIMFQFHEAAAVLRPHVQGIYSIHVEKGQLVEPQVLLPDGSCCLYINLGRPLTIIDPNGPVPFRRYTAPILARGVLSKPHFLDASMGLHVWVIKLRPDVWSERPQLSIAENEYTSHQELDQQFGPILELCRSRQPADKIAQGLVTEWERLIPEVFTVSNPAFQGILEEIRYSVGAAKIEETMQEFDLSYKTLERYFQQYVGTTPKDYAKILRIAATTLEMVLDSSVPTFRLKKLGFFDLAHFFKEFRRYFDTTPRKLMKDLPERSLMLTRRVTAREFALMR